MSEIYILIVKNPPTKERGCRACQFKDDYCCMVSGGKYLKYEAGVPEWCPLQKVEVLDVEKYKGGR